MNNLNTLLLYSVATNRLIEDVSVGLLYSTKQSSQQAIADRCQAAIYASMISSTLFYVKHV